MSHKKYGVYLGLSGPFDRVSKSTLGLKRPTLPPRYTIYTIYNTHLMNIDNLFQSYTNSSQKNVLAVLFVYDGYGTIALGAIRIK